MVDILEFRRHVGTMAIGTALAQIIPIAASPILTRLYSPEEFGVFASVVAIAGILLICATLRLELAIVLPGDDAIASDVAGCALFLALVTCLSGTLLLSCMPGLLDLLAIPSVVHPGAIPILTFLMALTQIFTLIANRERKYAAIATGAVGQQVTATGVSIACGAAGLTSIGLITGRIFGYVASCLYIGIALRGLLVRCVRESHPQLWFGAVRTYWQFPLFNVPYSLVGTFSREFVILGLTAFQQAAAAGYYGLARAVLMAPISFLSSSISQVFYKEAVVSIGTPEFARLTFTILRYIAIGTAPFFVFGWFWAPDVFDVVFGSGWREAGYYAAALMPIALLSLFTSWPERIFEVRQKQHISLIIQIIFDVAAIGAVYFALSSALSALVAVHIYVAIQIAYHLAYLFAVFKLANLNEAAYCRFLGLLSLSLALSTGFHYLVFLIPASIVVQFILSLVLMAILVLVFLRFSVRGSVWRNRTSKPT